MRYWIYVAAVFTITYGAIAIYLGSARKSYRKRYGK